MSADPGLTTASRRFAARPSVCRCASCRAAMPEAIARAPSSTGLCKPSDGQDSCRVSHKQYGHRARPICPRTQVSCASLPPLVQRLRLLSNCFVLRSVSTAGRQRRLECTVRVISVHSGSSFGRLTPAVTGRLSGLAVGAVVFASCRPAVWLGDQRCHGPAAGGTGQPGSCVQCT